MVDVNKIEWIKSATIGIGLVDEIKVGVVPIKMLGTGFIFNPKGYVMTASHLIESCIAWQKKFYDEKELKVFPVAFRVLWNEGLFYETVSFTQLSRFELRSTDPGYPGPQNLDFSIGKLAESSKPMPYLKIKEPHKPRVFDEVALCGYPMGEYSLKIENSIKGQRYSPVFQTGRIACLMAHDNSPKPWGLQTDIIGTGGSSGSPIVDPNDGEVIGIAQDVIPATFEITNSTTDVKIPDGYVKVGLVYGITNHLIHSFSVGASDYFEKGIEEGKFNITHIPKIYSNIK
jgi:hypothetical protein